MSVHRALAAPVVAATLVLSACGGGNEPTAAAADETSDDAGGVRVATPAEAAATIADPPTDLVILDVRTPEEFDEGHIEGAVMIDFYRGDFAEQLADLDPDVPYVLYCRSGNRSGQTRAMMEDLGFTSVADVEGGIIEWQSAGLPVVNG